jgi:3-oxoacyl-(acyl-carrier-protein) synthase
MRRVVVTGLGMVTPLACGVEETWSRLLAGQSGAGTITRFDSSNVVTQYACEIPMGDGSDGTFNADDWMEPKEQRKVDDFIIYGMAAAVQAVRDAGWDDISEDEKLRTGVMIGSGIGGLNSIAETAVLIKEKGPKRVSPFFIPGALINLSRAGLDPLRVQGAEPCGRHRLLDRGACHRRRGAADHVGRCRCDGCGRAESPIRDRYRRVQRLQGAVDQAGR